MVCVLGALTTMVVPAVPTAHASARMDRTERAIVKRVNGVRHHAGLRSVRLNHALARASDVHSRDMLRRDFFAHESSNGQSFTQRIEHFRDSRVSGEALAFLPAHRPGRTAVKVVRMWMASPGHRAELMNPKFRRIGIGKRRGRLYGQRTIVVTADLATRR